MQVIWSGENPNKLACDTALRATAGWFCRFNITSLVRERGWAEANVVELADGTLSMLIPADRLEGVLYRADSQDDGRTWSKAVKTDIPNPGSKATLYGLGGDTAVILHNPNAKQRNPLSLWIRIDEMRTWPYRRDLVTWPRRLNHPDGFVDRADLESR